MIVHFSSREQIPEGALLVSCGDEKEYVDLKSLDTVPVQGTVVNGKGEESEIDTQGVSLADVIEKAGFDPDNAAAVKVTADDEFSAELTGGEVNEAGKAYKAFRIASRYTFCSGRSTAENASCTL